MKKNKSPVLTALSVLIILFISGCLLPGENDSPEEISLSELDQLRSVLVGLESSFSLVPGNPAADSIAKGLNPVGLPEMMNGDLLYSPAEIHARYGGGSGPARYPAGNGRVSNYLQAGHEMYFTLQPVSGSIYRVRMFVYPLPDFIVDYSYYEYNVDSEAILSDYPWQVLNGNNEKGKYIVKRTYYSDGTFSNEDVLWDSNRPGPGQGQIYDTFSAPDVTLNTIADYYRYPEIVSEPSRSASHPGGYAAHTVSSVESAGSERTGNTFYTENSGLYSSLGYTRSGGRKTVVRSVYDAESGAYTLRSYSLEDGQSNRRYSEIRNVDQIISGGLRRYAARHITWYDGTISGIPGEDILVEIDEQDKSSFDLFAGIIRKSMNGSNWSVYDYRVSLLPNGAFKYRETLKGQEPYTPYNGDVSTASVPALSVKASEDPMTEIEAVFSASESTGLSVTVNLPSGTFDGGYRQGTLTGVFTTVKGKAYAAQIFKNSVLVNGKNL